MLESVERIPEKQSWQRPTIQVSPEDARGRPGMHRGGMDSADTRWTASSLSTPASNATLSPMGVVKASPWPDVALHPSTRSPITQEGEDWYAIDVAQAEASGPSDPELYHMPMVPKGPTRIDSSADDTGVGPDRSGSSTKATAPGRGAAFLNPCGCLLVGGGAVWHMLSLLAAERPLRKHREWAGIVVPDARQDGEPVGPDSPGTPNKGSLRRKLTFQAISGGAMEGGEERMVAPTRKKRRLAYALRRKHTRSYTRVWDRLTDEVFIFGENLFDLCTPSRMDSNLPLFTLAFIALNLITFAFMAGEYPAFVAAHPLVSSMHTSGAAALAPSPRGPGRSMPGIHSPVATVPHCPADVFGTGSQALVRWASRYDDCFRFRPDFLLLWGARGLNRVGTKKQWWRWFSSLVLADSAPQLAVTLGLFAVLGLHLEPRYGTLRIALLTLMAGIGGNFLDAAILGVCRLAIGGAAACFGLLSLFWADILLNFEAVRFPFLRIMAALACLAAFIVAALLAGYPYGFAPLGGFLAALFPSLLFLPHLKSEKYEWFLPYITLLAVLVFFGAVPAIVYLARLPHAPC